VGETDLTISYISKGEYCGEIALLFESLDLLVDRVRPPWTS